jgi:hypothetical protein
MLMCLLQFDYCALWHNMLIHARWMSPWFGRCESTFPQRRKSFRIPGEMPWRKNCEVTVVFPPGKKTSAFADPTENVEILN